MKNKFILIILTTVIVCGGLIAAAALNLDKILIKFSPEMYLGYTAVNTINKINEELDMIDEAMPEAPDFYDSHMLIMNLNTEKHRLNFTGDYNDDTPSIVFNGAYNDMPFEGYINNKETGLALPSILDVYFTFSTKNFGNEFIDGGADKLFPIGVTRDTDLTLPSDDYEDEEINAAKLANISKTLISDAQIHHDSKNDYFLILKSDNAKAAAKDFINLIKETPRFGTAVKRINRIAKSDLSTNVLDLLSEAIDNSQIGDTITVKYTQTKNYISRIQADIPGAQSKLSILLDSKGARLLDDYTISIVSDVNGSKVGFEYNANGSRMFKNEDKEDNRELRIFFGKGELAKLSSKVSIDKTNTNINGELNAELFNSTRLTIPFSGQLGHDSKLSASSDKIILNDENIGSASIELMPPGNLQIPKKEKFAFKELDAADLTEISDILKQ